MSKNWASVVQFLLGLLCFVGVFLYWYFLPYQFWLGVISSENFGLILGYSIMLIITSLLGFFVSFLLIIIGVVIWSVD